jgi:hypothetical protein
MTRPTDFSADQSGAADVLRYVVLHHTGIDKPHFDLMLETAPGSLLATWRLPRWPVDEQLPIDKLAAHRRDYLEYEGPLTGNRGEVRRVLAGTYRLDRQFDVLWDLTLLTPPPQRRLILATTEPEKWVAVPLSEPE